MSESMETAVISRGMKLTGDINSDGPIQVAGSVKGNVTTNDKLLVTGKVYGDCSAKEACIENAAVFGNVSTSSEIEVCEGTVIIGDISSDNAVISGAVQGNIDIHGDLALKKSAVVLGNIKSSRITIEEGAAVSGNISQCYAGVDLKKFFSNFDTEKSDNLVGEIPAEAANRMAKVTHHAESTATQHELKEAVAPHAETARQKRERTFEKARDGLIQADAARF